MNPSISGALSFTATLFAACLALVSTAFAQSQPPQPQIWTLPELAIPICTYLPVQLQSVKIRNGVSGRRTFTKLETTFSNPNARILEGALQFPLREGQSAASFAMDVNGSQPEAVPVDQARGQMVFEEVIRDRIEGKVVVECRATSSNEVSTNHPLSPPPRGGWGAEGDL